tara:strand:- start:5597 stop:6223 length:627 start_codon:yes stop_codon:yes gene_type:complete
MEKVNLGCGLSVVPGWHNIDGSPTVRLQRMIGVGGLFRLLVKPDFPSEVIYGNVVKGLPLESNSIDILYSSHMLEHLALIDFRLALSEISRVLKPGGVFRGVLPDLEIIVKDYSDSVEPNACSKFLRDSLLGIENRPSSIMGKLHSLIGNSNHLWMWDYKGIEEELRLAGFLCISRAEFNDSKNKDFAEIEDIERWEGCLGFECSNPA